MRFVLVSRNRGKDGNPSRALKVLEIELKLNVDQEGLRRLCGFVINAILNVLRFPPKSLV